MPTGRILGHGAQGMTARYGAGHDLKALSDAIAAIEYPGVRIGQAS